MLKKTNIYDRVFNTLYLLGANYRPKGLGMMGDGGISWICLREKTYSATIDNFVIRGVGPNAYSFCKKNSKGYEEFFGNNWNFIVSVRFLTNKIIAGRVQEKEKLRIKKIIYDK